MEVKRIFGGFAVFDQNGQTVKEFKGQGAKAKAEKFVVETTQIAGRGSNYRGGAYRG